MGIFEKKEEVNNPNVEETTVSNEEVAITQPMADKPKTEEPEDRSLYNCDACGGDGLLYDESTKRDVICPRCQGKGKLG